MTKVKERRSKLKLKSSKFPKKIIDEVYFD